MKKTKFLLILILGLFANQTQADISSGTYWGLEYSKMDTDLLISVGPPVDLRKPSLDTFIFRGGYFFADFLAVEFHLGSSLTEENSTGGVSAKANSIVAAFVRANLPLHAQNTNLYFSLGGSRVDIKLEDASNVLAPITTVTASGFSYAFGAELYATPSTALSIEYTRYLSEDAARINSLSIGFIRHFSLPKLF